MTVSTYLIVIFIFFFQQSDLELIRIREKSFHTPVQDIPSRQTITAQGSDKQSRSPLICLKKTQVQSSDELEIGDHVVFHRVFYDHHGIITNKVGSKFDVIEPTRRDSGSDSASSIVKGKAKLTLSSKTFDFKKGDISVVEYTSRNSKSDTALEAKRIYEESRKQPESYKYNLFTNNCEHFATYCATGKMYSLQVADFGSRGLPSYIKKKLKFKIKGDKEQRNQYICIPCEDIKSKNDIKKGDIIEYFENDIRCRVVVHNTFGPTSETVSCRVAHCITSASSSGKEIKKEDIVITFEKLFYKLNFESSEFDIDEPDVVVEKSNEQEEYSRQMAGSLTDACSQFPIWCKLKL